MTNSKEWQILAVEDDPDGQEVISGILKLHNIPVLTVETAELAIQALESQSYTAAVIDLALPGMDGIQLISQIRNSQKTAQMPCMAITAFHSASVKKQALAAGFDSYISKPINAASFLDNIRSVISNS
jgi:CheY-like chemotaxis protein